MNKKIWVIIVFLISIALLTALLLTAVQIAAFDINIYSDSYHKYNLYDTTRLTKRDYLFITEKILEYLNGSRDELYNRTIAGKSGETFFNSREVAHMQDVRALFDTGYLIRNISFFVLVTLIVSVIRIQKGDRRYAGKALVLSTGLLLFIAMSFLLLANTDFYRYFTVFHKIFFTNDLWLLNPKTDMLIKLFPLEFFNQMLVRILLYFVLQLLIVGSLGYFVYKQN